MSKLITMLITSTFVAGTAFAQTATTVKPVAPAASASMVDAASANVTKPITGKSATASSATHIISKRDSATAPAASAPISRITPASEEKLDTKTEVKQKSHAKTKDIKNEDVKPKPVQ